MDFFSIRKKARERAEARAREAAARPPEPAAPPEPPRAAEPPVAAPPRRDPESPAAAAPPPPAPPAAVAPPPAPPAAVAPPPAPQPAAEAPLEQELLAELDRLRQRPPPAAAAPDPLDDFFWREDETAPALPDLGLGSAQHLPAAPAVAPRELVAFLLGDEEYAVDIGRVREILKPPPVTEVPGAPPQVLGVITLRGEVVPVVDPRPALALPAAAPGPRARLVVCETADGTMALSVDGVSQVLRLPPAAIEARPQGISGPGTAPLRGVGREGDRLVILLDLDTLVRAAPAGAAP